VTDKRPKIHILFKFVEGPWGGGNQLLKALREYFRKAGIYSESPEDTDVILFNSYPFGSEYLFDSVFRLKKRLKKILIHRVDGPISYVRGRDRIIDEIICSFNGLLADGTIFQSNWSREKNRETGMKKSPYETVIMNAPAPTIFSREGKRPFNKEEIKLVATSWSGNVRRGFDIYEFLDNYLDFGKYEMTFVGNSPIEFKNITWIKPAHSRELASILKQHDIYITASRNDPCSNALIEALHCGLPAVARNDGGHPGIVGQAGQLFENESDVLQAIEEVAQNYEKYQSQIDLPTIDEVGQMYYDFAQTIYKDYLGGSYQPRQVHFGSIVKIKAGILRWKALSRIGVTT